MTAFIPIGPEPADGAEPVTPFDGEEVLVVVDIATVLVVRNAWWEGGANDGWDRGWWAPKHSVTTEKLEGIYAPTHWAPMPELPEELTR